MMFNLQKIKNFKHGSIYTSVFLGISIIIRGQLFLNLRIYIKIIKNKKYSLFIDSNLLMLLKLCYVIIKMILGSFNKRYKLIAYD